MEVKPNLFLIGAPRCGTTTLSVCLREHPQVYFSKMKEPQYFATDFRNRFVRYRRTYLKLFREADPQRHKIIAEGSTWYLFSREAVPRILKFQPEAKFIVMLRDPVRLVLSLHKFMVMHGKENLVDFKRAWYAEPQRRERGKGPLGCGDVKLVLYSEWGRLGSQVRRLLTLVPRERVFFILLDDFQENPRRIWLNLLDFLGLDDDGRTDFPRVNESIILRGILLRRVLGVARSAASFSMSWLGLAWSQALTFSPAWKRLFSPNSRAVLEERDSCQDDNVYEMLQRFFLPEVEELSHLLHRDLVSLWGYSQK